MYDNGSKCPNSDPEFIDHDTELAQLILPMEAFEYYKSLCQSCGQAINELKLMEEQKMNVNTKLLKPKYQPGEVIDLTYKTEGSLPNRIFVKTVYCREQDCQWLYEVILENTGCKTTMTEAFINERKANRTASVYKTQEIMERYTKGYRFCGNEAQVHAIVLAEKLKSNSSIAAIMLYPALDPTGRLIKDSYGIWIKYNHIIDDNGELHEYLDNGMGIRVK